MCMCACMCPQLDLPFGTQRCLCSVCAGNAPQHIWYIHMYVVYACQCISIYLLLINIHIHSSRGIQKENKKKTIINIEVITIYPSLTFASRIIDIVSIVRYKQNNSNNSMHLVLITPNNNNSFASLFFCLGPSEAQSMYTDYITCTIVKIQNYFTTLDKRVCFVFLLHIIWRKNLRFRNGFRLKAVLYSRIFG